MKREEAIKLLKQYQGYEPMSPDGETLKHSFDLTDETVDALLSALRPVSREQVEKVWRGEWIVQQDEHKEYIKKCSKCGFPISGWWGADKFCANCGAPMTDEAVDIMLKRLEALKDGTTD